MGDGAKAFAHAYTPLLCVLPKYKDVCKVETRGHDGSQHSKWP